MDQRLVVLKMFLDELGVPDSIDTVDDRKRVQKAIYLGQLSGLDLGYHFGWYLKGPYSTALTKDYYSLAEAIDLYETEYAGRTLPESVRSRLGKIKPLLAAPEDSGLAQEDWLELISSLHYLRMVQHRDREGALGVLEREKPRLVPFAGRAEERLVQAELLV